MHRSYIHKGGAEYIKVYPLTPCLHRPTFIASLTARLDKVGSLRLDWKLDCEPRELAETWVRWSNDGGRTWRALTVGQKGTSVIIDPEQLPSGELTFQLLAHDGSTR